MPSIRPCFIEVDVSSVFVRACASVRVYGCVLACATLFFFFLAIPLHYRSANSFSQDAHAQTRVFVYVCVCVCVCVCVFAIARPRGSAFLLISTTRELVLYIGLRVCVL